MLERSFLLFSFTRKNRAVSRSIVKYFHTSRARFIHRSVTTAVRMENKDVNPVKIAVVQMNCTNDKGKNLKEMLESLQSAVENDARMVFFPEGVDYIATSTKEAAELAETLEGPLMKEYQQAAKKHGVYLSLGGFHERLNEMRDEKEGIPWISNDHVLISPEGTVSSVYRKMHLFDVDIPEKKIRLKESSYVKAGRELVLTECTPVGRIGLGVCYDLRFPEFSMALRHQGASVLTFPSAFTYYTGQAHWESLLRARAIENQSFVIAAAQCGNHNPKRRSYGNSMIVGPFGEVMARAGTDSPEIIYAEIDVGALGRVREEMPVITHKIAGMPEVLANYWSPPSHDAEISSESTITAVNRKGCSVPADCDTTFMFGIHKSSYKYVFLENQHAVASVNRKCVVPGHVLIITKRIAKRVQDLTPEEIASVFQLTQKVQEIMEKIHGAGSSTITIQDGKDAGQTVEHVHCHVLPRIKEKEQFKNDDIYEILATHDKGPDVVWRPYEEMEKECNDIRAFILKNANLLK